MSQFTWESESVANAEAEPQAMEPEMQGGTLALSRDDFSALEERIVRAVNLVKRERAAHTAAEERAGQAELQLRQQSPLVENLQKEVNSLRAERDQVRQRVDRLLAQLDALEV